MTDLENLENHYLSGGNTIDDNCDYIYQLEDEFIWEPIFERITNGSNTLNDLSRILEEIIKQSLIEIEFIISNSDNINKLSEGIINLNKLDNFRAAITIVYMVERNKGILSRIKLDFIYQLIDEDVINEMMLDREVYAMSLNQKNKITQSLLSKQNFSSDY